MVKTQVAAISNPFQNPHQKCQTSTHLPSFPSNVDSKITDFPKRTNLTVLAIRIPHYNQVPDNQLPKILERRPQLLLKQVRQKANEIGTETHLGTMITNTTMITYITITIWNLRTRNLNQKEDSLFQEVRFAFSVANFSFRQSFFFYIQEALAEESILQPFWQPLQQPFHYQPQRQLLLLIQSLFKFLSLERDVNDLLLMTKTMTMIKNGIRRFKKKCMNCR